MLFMRKMTYSVMAIMLFVHIIPFFLSFIHINVTFVIENCMIFAQEPQMHVHQNRELDHMTAFLV